MTWFLSYLSKKMSVVFVVVDGGGGGGGGGRGWNYFIY